MSQLSFREQLEKHNNPEEVRQRLAAGKYNQPHAAIAREYLASLERNRADEISARSEAREEETLAIANEALSVAKQANQIAKEGVGAAQESAASASKQARWARWAAVISMLAAVVAAKDQISALFFG